MSSRKGSRGSTRRVDGESNLQSQSSNQQTHSEGANSNVGQAIGPNATHFAHILGSTLRHSNIVSLQAEGWWKVSKEEKDKLWKEITAVAKKNSGKFDEYLANQESASLTPNEFYISATGPVRHGRMHGYGLGAPPSKVLGPKTSGQSSFGSYSQVCNKLGNVLNEMDQLKTNMCERIEERVQEETKKIEERVQEETKKIEERMEERIQEKMMAFMAQYTQQCQQNRR
ncbi:hypothetical protein L1049_020024 [Liquidambar formosana]|uniref:Uncharacterized protein n=1 Tax=Liquidambar formosana TaxID=63359 RepID=A0AAP0SDE2_LIQFO